MEEIFKDGQDSDEPEEKNEEADNSSDVLDQLTPPANRKGVQDY